MQFAKLATIQTLGKSAFPPPTVFSCGHDDNGDYQLTLNSCCQAVFVGMGISAPAIGLIGDKYGRKAVSNMLLLSSVYFGVLCLI